MTSAEVRLSAAEAAESVDGGEAVGIPSLEAVRGMAAALSQGTTVAREASRPSSACWELRLAAYNVRFHDAGVKRFHHPVVGDLTSASRRCSCPPTRA